MSVNSAISSKAKPTAAPPSITAIASQSLTQGSAVPITGLSITDAAAGSATLTVILSDSSGLLNVTSASGLTVTGANSKQLSLTGTLATVNSALSHLTYTGSAAGSDSLSINVTDNGDSLTAKATESLSVLPPLSVGGITSNGAISDTATISPFANLTLTDNLSATLDRVSATVSFTAANGVLSGAGLSAGTVNNGVISYVLSATGPAQLQQELNALVFTPSAHQVSPGNTVATSFR